MGITAAELSDTHLRGLFQTIDDTGDGFIEFQEFRDWLTGARARRRRSLKVLDHVNLAVSVEDASSPHLLSKASPRDRAKAAQEYELSQKQARAIPAKPESLMQRLGMVHRSHRAAQRQSSPQEF